jgi:2,3-bisphosphoglycerate-independent phosphoglycerate mutase
VRCFFFFLDGVGLGADDPATNPLSATEMPNLQALLSGQKLVAASAPNESSQATLLALDACLGVPGLPQSATGQASLLTGINVPAKIGYHYGPKPNQ